MITFQEESFEDILEEFKGIHDLHWEEVELHQDKIPLDPDYEMYKLLDVKGALHVMTARADGEFIGYFISLIQHSLHHMSTFYAISDLIFIHPDYRKGRVGYNLIKETEIALTALGVDVINMIFKIDKDMEAIMKHSGFEKTEVMYSKYVGEL